MSPSCFEAVRDLAAQLPSLAGARGSWPSVAEIDATLAPLAGVCFVAGEKRRATRRPGRRIDPAELYEIRIATRGEVPTRADSLHDFFNALAWAAFPASKRALTERLAGAQRARLGPAPWRLPGRRTRAHDRLALLDEGGILVAAGARGAAPGAAAAAAAAPDGDATGEAGAGEAGLAAALADGRARALVFGHALLEHALAGGAHVWGAALVFAVDPEGTPAELRGRLDRALAAALASEGFLDRAEPWLRLSLTSLGR